MEGTNPTTDASSRTGWQEGPGGIADVAGTLPEEDDVGHREIKRRRLLGSTCEVVRREGGSHSGSDNEGEAGGAGEGEGLFCFEEEGGLPATEASLFTFQSSAVRDPFGVRDWTNVQWDAFWESRGFTNDIEANYPPGQRT